jgi:type I restriction enzyme, S subunit
VRNSAYKIDKLVIHAVIDTGFPFKSEHFTDRPDDIPLVKGENLQQGYIDWNAARYWSKNDVHNYEKYWLKPNDIVIAMDRPWVQSGLKWSYIKPHEPNAFLVQRVARLRSKKTVYQKFLRCLIGSEYFSNYIQPIVTGVNVPHISAKQIGDFLIPIPPMPLQKKIAAIVSAYDDLIENNDRRIALLEKMAEEIYREWFVRLRFPGHEQVTFHKGIPEGWEVIGLETLCKEIRNGVKIKSLDSNTKYLGLEHLPRKSILIKNFDAIDSVQSDKLLFKERDILFGKIRPYLHKVVLANFTGACSSDTIVIRSKKNEYGGFLLFTIFSDTFIELATTSSKGTKMPRANWDFLKKLEIILPNHKILALYQEKFDAYFSLMCKISNSNEILKQTRDRLLTRLISGKLSVEDLDIQFPSSMTETVEATHDG